MSVRVIQGDSLLELAKLPDASVDSCVTDPPYHLTTGKKGGSGPASVNLESPYGRARVTTGFMGMTWDGGDVAHNPALWAEVLRVLKPGGYCLAFGGTRTYHRLACAIEDAGFEIRDQIGWAFGSGFPKSHNGPWGGTALKPAWEPIVMARKPLIGTVAANVQQFGTGGLNIDECRVEPTGEVLGGGDQRATVKTATNGWNRPWMQDPEMKAAHSARVNAQLDKSNTFGRWPANLIHDGSEEVLACFPTDAGGGFGTRGALNGGATKWGFDGHGQRVGFGDTGSAARFFYCAKASREDREDGCRELSPRTAAERTGRTEGSAGLHTTARPNVEGGNPYAGQSSGVVRNHHPTVKPTDLMRYLCRLVTPKGGTVLDPFMGSGSTGRGAIREGFSFIGIEIDAEYCEIASKRIHADAPLFAEVAA